MRMGLTCHQLLGTFADALGTPAAQEAAMVQEELQQTQVAVMRLSSSEDLHHAGQQALGSGAHVYRASRQPQGVEADHRSHSRSQAAHSPEHCSGQLTVMLDAPRRNSMRMSLEVVAAAGYGNCTGKNSVPEQRSFDSTCKKLNRFLMVRTEM